MYSSVQCTPEDITVIHNSVSGCTRKDVFRNYSHVYRSHCGLTLSARLWMLGDLDGLFPGRLKDTTGTSSCNVVQDCTTRSEIRKPLLKEAIDICL